jgi:pimeloyl-ACP methyl ester carboxylesterase
MIAQREMRVRSSTRGVELAVAVAEPVDRDARGVVVLLSGSGPQDRDQTVDGVPTLSVFREALAANGFVAVSWDDRGVGDSDGDYMESASGELVDDALAVLDELSDRGLPVFVAGHSQGALIAAQVAARLPVALCGLVLMAGSGRPGREVLVEQHRRLCAGMGWPPEETERLLRFKVECFDVLETFAERLTRGDRDGLRERLTEIVVRHLGDEESGEIIDDLMEWEWRFLLGSDPAVHLRRVEVPTFVATGGKDLQVHPEADQQPIVEALEQGRCPSVTSITPPHLNHLFQLEEGEPTASYADLGAPFHPALTDPLVAWLNERVKDLEVEAVAP